MCGEMPGCAVRRTNGSRDLSAGRLRRTVSCQGTADTCGRGRGPSLRLGACAADLGRGFVSPAIGRIHLDAYMQ